MNEYLILLKKDLWYFKNYFTEIRREPKRLVTYIAFLVFVGIMVLNFVVNKRAFQNITTPGSNTVGFLGAGSFAYFAFVCIFPVYNATKNCPAVFSTGDVNLLFTSPLSSKKILVWNMVKRSIIQIPIAILPAFGMLPVFSMFSALNGGLLWYFYLSLFFLIISVSPLSFLIFSISTEYRAAGPVRNIFKAIGLLFLAYLGYMALSSPNPLEGLLDGLNSKLLDSIPIIGWSRLLLLTPFNGAGGAANLTALAYAVFIAACILLNYIISGNYYEDALNIVEKVASIKRNVSKNQMSLSFQLGKNRVVRVKGAGTGPWSLFWKSKVERTRSGINAYIGLSIILYIGLAAVFGLIGLKSGSKQPPLVFVLTANGIIAYMYLVFSVAIPLEKELTKPYIFLIPGSPFLKMLAASLLDITRVAIDSAVMNIILWFMLRPPLWVLPLGVVFIVSFYTLNIFSGYLVRLLFPSSLDQKALFILFKLLQIILLLMPAIIAAVITGILTGDTAAVFTAITVSNLAVSSVLLMLGGALLERLELR